MRWLVTVHFGEKLTLTLVVVVFFFCNAIKKAHSAAGASYKSAMGHLTRIVRPVKKDNFKLVYAWFSYTTSIINHGQTVSMRTVYILSGPAARILRVKPLQHLGVIKKFRAR